MEEIKAFKKGDDTLFALYGFCKFFVKRGEQGLKPVEAYLRGKIDERKEDEDKQKHFFNSMLSIPVFRVTIAPIHEGQEWQSVWFYFRGWGVFPDVQIDIQKKINGNCDWRIVITQNN